MGGRWTEVEVREGGMWKIRHSTVVPKIEPNPIIPRVEPNFLAEASPFCRSGRTRGFMKGSDATTDAPGGRRRHRRLELFPIPRLGELEGLGDPRRRRERRIASKKTAGACQGFPATPFKHFRERGCDKPVF